MGHWGSQTESILLSAERKDAQLWSLLTFLNLVFNALQGKCEHAIRTVLCCRLQNFA